MHSQFWPGVWDQIRMGSISSVTVGSGCLLKLFHIESSVFGSSNVALGMLV